MAGNVATWSASGVSLFPPAILMQLGTGPTRTGGARVVRETLHSGRGQAAQNFETRVSFAVMNSSRAGLPACVCSMPRRIAALISPGWVTRSP